MMLEIKYEEITDISNESSQAERESGALDTTKDRRILQNDLSKLFTTNFHSRKSRYLQNIT